MIKNYIKLAVKVMLRKKYYTFLSLLCISFTIMIITVFASFIDQIIGENDTEPSRNRTLIMESVKSYEGKDTDVNKPSFYFLQKNLRGLENVSTVSLFSDHNFISFRNGNNVGHALKYTDENFWKIARFRFVEGNAFNALDVKRGSRVAIINEKTKDYYFGKQPAIGKTITIYGQAFKVTGVVKPPSPFSRIYSDVYVPYTQDENLHRTEKAVQGTYSAVLLSKSDNIEKVRVELKHRMRAIGTALDGADSLKVFAFTAFEQFAKNSSYDDAEPEYGKVAIILFCITLLFMTIPAISLVNLNVNRIVERAEEIGVRKSFGATSSTLAAQFIIENLILTVIGGLIGLVFSVYISRIFIHLVNAYDPLFKIPIDSMVLNWRIFIVCMFTCFIFSLLSGVYPAWKMSRLNAVESLKGGKLL
jgi:putative ABC transport system permease protein